MKKRIDARLLAAAGLCMALLAVPLLLLLLIGLLVSGRKRKQK